MGAKSQSGGSANAAMKTNHKQRIGMLSWLKQCLLYGEYQGHGGLWTMRCAIDCVQIS